MEPRGTNSEDIATPGAFSGYCTPAGRWLTTRIAFGTLHDAVTAPPAIRTEPWGALWPDNVHETGVLPEGQSGSPIVAAEGQRVE